MDKVDREMDGIKSKGSLSISYLEETLRWGSVGSLIVGHGITEMPP